MCRILSSRRHAKVQWWQQLQQDAKAGSPEATVYIRRRTSPTASFQQFVQTQGGPAQAAEALESRMREVFTNNEDVSESISQICSTLDHKAANTDTPLFTLAELERAVVKLKDNKTSGLSGMSAEYVKCLMSAEGGSALLFGPFACWRLSTRSYAASYFSATRTARWTS